jgi:hypothetical protein
MEAKEHTRVFGNIRERYWIDHLINRALRRSLSFGDWLEEREASKPCHESSLRARCECGPSFFVNCVTLIYEITVCLGNTLEEEIIQF